MDLTCKTKELKEILVIDICRISHATENGKITELKKL
jgi:hypothetical protein